MWRSGTAAGGWCTGSVVTPLVFRHGAAEVAFAVAIAVWAVFELVMRVRQHLLSRGPAAVDRSAFVLLPCLGAAIVAAEVLGRRGGLPWPGGPVWPFVTGIILIAAGVGLRAWSIVTLGRFFQYWIKVQPGHRVVGGAGLAVRIRAEERQLTDSLGEEYEQFAAGRKRLVPGVW